MPAVARIGDTTTGVCNKGLPCCPHGRTGTDATASPNVTVNGIPLHRLHDTGPTNCPHGGTFESVVGSNTVTCNGRRVVRIGDATVCQSCGMGGTHSSGSPNVTAGG